MKALVSLAALALVLSLPTAEAGTWCGKAGNNRFSDAANWQEGIVPVEGDSLLFEASANVLNDLQDVEFAAVTVTNSSKARVVVTGCGLPATAYCIAPSNSELSVGGEGVAPRVGKLLISGGGKFTFAASPKRRLCRIEVSDASTLKVDANVTVRTAVLDLQGGDVAVMSSGRLDAFSVVRLDGAPLSKGTYTGYGDAGTHKAFLTGKGPLVVGTAAVATNAHAQAILNALKTLSATNRWLASWRAPWSETASTFCERDESGEWVPLDPQDANLDSHSTVYRTIGVHPYMYFLDFYRVAGTWYGEEAYRKGRAQLAGIIRAAYDRWRAVPVFSWHFENPYVPTGCNENGPYRYRYKSTDYPAEHRYMLNEVLQNTGETCGLGRCKASLAQDAVAVKNPKRWFDERLDEIAAFIDTLRDKRGRRIPIIIRLMHECEDDWSCWGRYSVSLSDYRAMFRYIAEGLRWRTGGDGTLLFGYCTDRYFTKMNEDLTSATDYMSRYPGDDVVDIMGHDDYKLGVGETEEEKESYLAQGIAKIAKVTAMAESRGKACGLFETGIAKNPDEAYVWHYRAFTGEGCRFAFLNTWGDQTIPKTEAGIPMMVEYMAKDEVITVQKDYFPFAGVGTDYFGGAATSTKPINVGATNASCVAWYADAARTTLAGNSGAIVDPAGRVVTPSDGDDNCYILISPAKMGPSTMKGAVYLGADVATFGTNVNFTGSSNPGNFTFPNLTLNGGKWSINGNGTVGLRGSAFVAGDFEFSIINHFSGSGRTLTYRNDLKLAGSADSRLIHSGTISKVMQASNVDVLKTPFTVACDASDFKGTFVVTNAPTSKKVDYSYMLLNLTSATSFGSTNEDANPVAVSLGNHGFVGLSSQVVTGTRRAIMLDHDTGDHAGVEIAEGDTVTIAAPIVESAAITGNGCFHKRGEGTLLMNGAFAPKAVVVDEGMIGTLSDSAVSNVTSWTFAKGVGIHLAKESQSTNGLLGTIVRLDESTRIPVTLSGYDSTTKDVRHAICTLSTPNAADMFELSADASFSSSRIVRTEVTLGQTKCYRYSARLNPPGLVIRVR